MKAWEKVLHVLVFLAWGGGSLYFALRVAAYGSEEDRLEYQRGADLTIRQKAVSGRNELQTEIDWASRREVIDSELRRLCLSIRPGSGETGSADASLATVDVDHGGRRH